MSELGELAAIFAKCSCVLALLFWLVLLAGWALAGEKPDEEEADDE